MNLFQTKTFCIHKTIKVVVVDEYKKFILAALKVVLSCFESFDNG